MIWMEFFSTRLPHIYLVYGLAFFLLGFAIALEIWRTDPTPFSRTMWPLAFFGLVHGSHEWLEMFSIIGRDAYGFRPTGWFELLRLMMLAVSFTALIMFGAQVFWPPTRVLGAAAGLGLGMFSLFGLGIIWFRWGLDWQEGAWLAAADALARYLLAVPGAVLTAWALLSYRRTFLQSPSHVFTNDLLWAASAFLLYGIIGQVFIGSSPLFPSTVINADLFQRAVGLPIQLFRAVMACVAAVFTIRALRSFEFTRQQSISAARLRVQEEEARRDTLRRQFLQRIVEMQEDERARIARELHDELGQVLTGLAIGLRGVQTSLEKPVLLQEQLSQLEDMAVQALTDMRRLVNELRPAILDDMGLAAALRHYVDTFKTVTGIDTSLLIYQNQQRLPRDVETTLFRITQEALTNVARHARASQARIELTCDEYCAILQVKDNGQGFDAVERLDTGTESAGWGLMGIQERVKLFEGYVDIQSEPDQGANLLVEIPLTERSSYQRRNNGTNPNYAGGRS